MAHITFIHGIANKPEPEVLHRMWRQALAVADGVDLSTEGVTSSMVYWADVLYAAPVAEQAAQESAGQDTFPANTLAAGTAWRAALSGDQKEFVDRLSERLRLDAIADDALAPRVQDIGPGFERVPLPGFLKKDIMQTFLRDVHHFLFNVSYSPRPGVTFAVQDEIRGRLLGALGDAAAHGTPPHVLVSHSMGTVIAYDCLKRAPGCPRVDAFMTVGCPLGLDEVQDQLQPEWSREDGYPRHRLDGPWANVYDKFDPVCGFDPVLADDYKRGSLEIVEDINEQNWGKWRHDITKYLAGPKLRARLQKMLTGK
jgi:hypothetical protein